MKAWTVPAYGGPEALLFEEVEAPAPREEEVLVEIAAASVNAADTKIMRGEPFPLRLAMGMRRPRIKALGADVSGTVRALGAKVSTLAVGDEVLADLSGSGFGAFAEQVCAPEHVWVKKPTRLSHIEAAALPMAGMTAFRALQEIARIAPGQRVLILGATGGVGSFAVQMARAFGAEVSATSRPEKADLLLRLGVSEVVDAATLSEAVGNEAWRGRFHLVVDCAAFQSPFVFRRVLAKGGRYLQVGGSVWRLVEAGLLGPLVGIASGRRYGSMLQTPSQEQLAAVVALVEDEKVHPIIDDVFPLAELPAAIRRLEGRLVRGKVVLSVD